nr:MAG TPA: ribonucleoside-diphosphate reductase subunit alpha [Caudoviricetes sp.]DAU13325.1 MAG TPA: ribonucleoside-diphosphate reductase subunit alpha [Caudoviricetes sp.]
MIKTVIKRDGTKQPFDGAKLSDWVKWATKDIDTQYIDWSGVVLKVISLLPEEVTSQELQRVLIKTCVDKGTYEYTKMAGRLLAASLPKEFYPERKYPHIKELHKRMEEDGLIVKPNYTDEEYDQINQMLNHEKDFTYEEYAINHAINKNSLWNKKTKKKYETPQFIFMRVVMQIFNNYQEKDRMEKIKDLYELVSDRKINVPTPYFSSSLTKNSSVSSCAVVLAKDTAQSIGVANTLAYELTTKGAGLGMQMNIRSLGDEVRGGMISHQGKVPYYRAIGDIIKSSKQGSRGGALTMYVPVLDPEIVTITNLKNPTSTEANRVRTIDYGVCLNNYFLEKVAKNENTYLFSVKDNEELNQLFFKDPDNKFGEKLEEFAKNNPDKVTEVKARDILRDVLVQSLETGRIYLFFTDNNNTHTPYNDTIYNSNLCCEISLPTKPFETYSDLYRTTSLTPVKEGEYDLMLDNGQVAFCNLAGLEVSRLYDNDEEYEKAAYYALLMIDEGINNAELGFPALNKSIRDWRSAGVSMIGLAHLLARKHLDYTSKEGKQFIHDLAEKNYYFLLKAAIRLTKERGVTPASSQTKWVDGWLPIDTYKKTVDEIVPNEFKQDWEMLRKEVKSLKGLRFTTLTTIVPSESSSLLLASSNSLYAVRNLVLVKQNGDNAVTWIAPEATKLKQYYQSAWKIPPKDMIEVYAIVQKFTDQGISADMWYDRSEQLEIPVSTLMQHTLWMNKYGMKGRYYVNSKTEKDLDLTVAATNIDRQNFEKDEEEKGCDSGGCTL